MSSCLSRAPCPAACSVYLDGHPHTPSLHVNECVFACTQMSFITAFVKLTVDSWYAKALGLDNAPRVRELLRAHFTSLHFCGYNGIPWHVLEPGYMEIEPIFNLMDLPDGARKAAEGFKYLPFTGILKFTLRSKEDWEDVSAFMHTGWEEDWPTYETVLWQLSLQDALVD